MSGVFSLNCSSLDFRQAMVFSFCSSCSVSCSRCVSDLSLIPSTSTNVSCRQTKNCYNLNKKRYCDFLQQQQNQTYKFKWSSVCHVKIHPDFKNICLSATSSKYYWLVKLLFLCKIFNKWGSCWSTLALLQTGLVFDSISDSLQWIK